jgi:hypothetical protein
MTLKGLECPVSKLVNSDACSHDRCVFGPLPLRLPAVRARLGRLSALSGSHSKSVFYDIFVWARGALSRLATKIGGFRPGQGGGGEDFSYAGRFSPLELHRLFGEIVNDVP